MLFVYIAECYCDVFATYCYIAIPTCSHVPCIVTCSGYFACSLRVTTVQCIWRILLHIVFVACCVNTALNPLVWVGFRACCCVWMRIYIVNWTIVLLHFLQKDIYSYVITYIVTCSGYFCIHFEWQMCGVCVGFCRI